MKLNKYISLILMICLLLTAAGCGNKTISEPEVTATTPDTYPVETQTVSEETQQKALENPLPVFQKSATLEPTVLYDENNMKITVTGLSYNNYSAEVELLLENNSDKPMTFICESMGYSCNSVNNYMIEDGYLNCTVDPGKKANDSISFSIQELMLHGIYEIYELEIGFDIGDEDYNHLYTGPLHAQTSAYDAHKTEKHNYLDTMTNSSFTREMGVKIPFTSQEIFYDENGIKILSACFMENKDGKQLLMLEAENGTDQQIHLTTQDISLNGLKVQKSNHSGLTVNPGKRGLLTVSPASAMDEAFWDSYGITQLSSVSFCLAVNDQEWNPLAESNDITIRLAEDQSAFDAAGSEVYNENGIRIIDKGLIKNTSEYNNNQHILLLVSNESEQPVMIEDVYKSVSCNGFMTSYYFYGQKLLPGQSGVIRIELTDSSLEKNNIVDITEVELRLNINDEEITLAMTY